MGGRVNHEARLGKTFNRLTVAEYSHMHRQAGGTPVHYYRCVCSCGNTVVAVWRNVEQGRVKSCGCYMRDKLVARQLRHGHTVGHKPTKAWRIWHGMVSRCHSKSNRAYPLYGGRGIYVCDRWRESFENFFSDMGDAPEGKTLDRIDNDGPYSPDNCRWATSAEQSLNRRVTVKASINGVTKPAAVWAIEAGAKPDTVRARLARGWSHHEAIYGRTA